MTATEILDTLRSLGSESYKRVLLNHRVQEPVFGVKIEELKKIQKRIKKDYPLSLELYDSGNYDAQYLAGLIADESRMTKKDLRHWLAKANSQPLCGTVVAGVAAESRYGWELACDWIDSSKEQAAATGWTTLSGLVSIRRDEDLAIEALERLIDRVEQSIHKSANDVRYAMNGFVIAAGCFVAPLTKRALSAGERIGPVSVDMGNTACQVPFAPDYIRKVQARGTIGKKRKSARC